jgi:ubiquinone/menaquinone biosynthesis C-methylase UbiE
MVVGEHGKIYAIDKNKDALHELAKRAEKNELKNIERITITDQIKLRLSNESVDLVLLYDVLHLVENRQRLLEELYRILRPLGILSVYPRHHEEDMNMSLEEVMKEIESRGFRFQKKTVKTLMHDDQLVKGEILAFSKI